MQEQKAYWMERPWLLGAEIGGVTKDTKLAMDICESIEPIIQDLLAECLQRGREEVERLIDEQIKDGTIFAYQCGAIENNNDQLFAGGCGGKVDVGDAYRCVDCTASFHRKCMLKHFTYPSEKGIKEHRKKLLE